MTTLFFAYSIVPAGQDEPRLVTGILYASSLETAQHHVQTLNSREVTGKSDLEVILRDMSGSVVWRGPYLGSDSNA